MRRRGSWLLLLLPLIAALAAPPASAANASSYCQWVCVNESCRLEASPDSTCEGGPTVLEVAEDPEAAACLPEPVTLDMVMYSASDVALAQAFKTGTAAPPGSQPSTQPTTPAPQPPTGPQPPAPQPPAPQPPAPQPPAPQPPAPQPPAPQPPPKQDVLLTGFCKFRGVPENPTERILPALEKKVKELCGADINLTSQCLKVEPEAIRNCKIKGKIVISLGVDPNKDEVRIENAAANCYIGDDGKVKCVPGCIDKDNKPLPDIQAPGPWPPLPDPPKIGGYPVIPGKPGTTGTYVCNATYYWMCTQKECKPYFIHVPNFGKDKDAEMVDGLAKIICDTIKVNKPKATKNQLLWTFMDLETAEPPVSRAAAGRR